MPFSILYWFVFNTFNVVLLLLLIFEYNLITCFGVGLKFVCICWMLSGRRVVSESAKQCSHSPRIV